MSFAAPVGVEVRLVRRNPSSRKRLPDPGVVLCSVPLYPHAATPYDRATADRVSCLHAAILAAGKVADVLAAHIQPLEPMAVCVCFSMRNELVTIPPGALEALEMYRDSGNDGLLVVLLRLVHSPRPAATWAEIGRELESRMAGLWA